MSESLRGFHPTKIRQLAEKLMLVIKFQCGRPSFASTLSRLEGATLVSNKPKRSNLFLFVHSWTAFYVWRLLSPQIFQLPILII